MGPGEGKAEGGEREPPRLAEEQQSVTAAAVGVVSVAGEGEGEGEGAEEREGTAHG